MMPPRTTDLPENVVNAILMRLPLRDAMRTSILSKKWRYNWCRLPQLTLDDKLWKTTDNFPSPSIKFASIMYSILTLHCGPVTKFTLSMSELKKYPQIGSLIYFLSRNGIEHLVLQFSEWNRYKLPPSFFTCSQLRHLTLQNCLICPPPAFKGFDMLISLELCYVSISSTSLESLISCSPFLENLVLKISDTVNHIQIKAPNLRSFDFSGCIKLISLNNVPLLAKLSLLYGESFEESEKCDLDKCFQSHHALEHLRLEYGSVQFLVAEVPRRLSLALNHLKRLCVFLDGLDDLSCALCLLRSSPYLQDLDVKVSMDESDDEADDISTSFSDVTLNHVRTVKVKGITGTKLDMQLIKLLLAKSPMLVRMLIEPDFYWVNKEKGAEILAELSTFQRASRKAEIVYQLEREWN
uniref:F-box/FBD/LRR-repeat protein At1g13570-like n=1 Tax=Nicotiana sylvestris TaxID=4096 RepID=A0A1U7YID6_NICSY|nr:PREDICTED: F-box/FBD/LRR-repeat protein At1g13570-like [Nicotiana sylvestris]XP_009803871.1 PREDICTED: F-box/FBD/LRR-repeat protein At1g13570-like [Nicotiana sylvestris]XP_009803872.1 PREDICTED: F-box/FBD/LRR-repeat protein At1g13570-like [Nicotiana sylvestris]XP_009803873.1 PREDICTED: F-box/FBD/LRR-repeat protein At1g13570-like [Nicotiana sylvestris]